jgi:hypothetical protein
LPAVSAFSGIDADNNRPRGGFEIDCFYVRDKEYLWWWKRCRVNNLHGSQLLQ